MRKHNPAPLEYGVVSPQRLCTCSGWPYPPKKSCIKNMIFKKLENNTLIGVYGYTIISNKIFYFKSLQVSEEKLLFDSLF